MSLVSLMTCRCRERISSQWAPYPPNPGVQPCPPCTRSDNELGAAAVTRGCRPGPRGVWAVAPAVSPHCLRGTRHDLSCTSAGEPRTPKLSGHEPDVCTNLCTRRARARRHGGDAQTLTHTCATRKPTSPRPPETGRDGRDVRRTAHNPATRAQ